MTEDAEPRSVDGQFVQHRLAKLVAHIRVHPIVPRPRLLRRVDVKARADAEVPRRALARNARAARTRVRRDERHAVLRSEALCARLDREGLFGASEAREIKER